jgi:hypothetical protein
VSSNSPEGSGVMRVRTELVLEQLVSRVLGRALELRPGEVSPELEAVLDEGPEPRELARLGYTSRVAETEMFEPAQKPIPRLAEMLDDRIQAGASRSEAVAEVSRELAAEEPEEKPEPGEGSWRVPGPGGHVRHFVALTAADELRQGKGDGEPAITRELSAGETKRCFLYGFYARCCEEAAGPTSS